MRIEKEGNLFVAHIKFEQRLVFRAQGWVWDTSLRKWTTTSVQKAFEFKEFAVGKAREEIEAYAKGEGATVVASHAHDSDIYIPAPGGLDYLPFQRAGIDYAAMKMDEKRPGVLIADKPGLGKTIQAIGLVNLYEKPRGKIIIICPAYLKINWRREFEKWDTHGLSVGLVKTVAKTKLDKNGQPMRKEPTAPGRKGPLIKETVDVWPDTDVVIINKELFDRHTDKLYGTQWTYRIVDEAHMFCNPKAHTSKFIWGGGKGKARVRPIEAVFTLFLTGTPITARPINLWSFCRFLDPRGLGKDWHYFTERYCGAYDNGFAWDTSGSSNLQELNIKLRDAFMVRRDKQAVLGELPPKRRQIVILPDDGMAKAVERELTQARRMLAEFEAMMGIEEDDNALVDGLNKLFPETYEDMEFAEQAALLGEDVYLAFEEFSAYRKALAIAKAPLVKNLIDEYMDAGEKVIVFCYHKEVADYFKKLYPDCAFVTGKTPTNKRQAQVDRFQEDEDCNPIVGNIDAAGVGYTMTAARTVIVAEGHWLSSALEQAEDRAWRIGQLNAVNVLYPVVQGSMEARMMEIVIDRMEDNWKALD